MHTIISNIGICYYIHVWLLVFISACGSFCMFLNEEHQLL